MERPRSIMGILSRFWLPPQEETPGIAAVHPPSKGSHFTRHWHWTEGSQAWHQGSPVAWDLLGIRNMAVEKGTCQQPCPRAMAAGEQPCPPGGLPANQSPHQKRNHFWESSPGRGEAGSDEVHCRQEREGALELRQKNNNSQTPALSSK